MYDILPDKTCYRRELSIVYLITLSVSGITYLLAPLLFESFREGPFLLMLLSILLAKIFLLRVKSEGTTSLRSSIGLNELKGYITPRVRSAILLGALSMTIMWTATLLYQPLFKHHNISLSSFGWYYLFFSLAGAVGGYCAGRLNTQGVALKRHLLGATLLLLLGNFCLLSNASWGLYGLGLCWFAHYFINTIVVERILYGSKIDVRATLVSCKAFIGSILLIFTRVSSGAVSDMYGIQAGVLSVVVMVLILSVALALVSVSFSQTLSE